LRKLDIGNELYQGSKCSLFFLSVVEIEPKVSFTVCKHCTTELYPRPKRYVFWFWFCYSPLVLWAKRHVELRWDLMVLWIPLPPSFLNPSLQCLEFIWVTSCFKTNINIWKQMLEKENIRMSWYFKSIKFCAL
jgi:hypothetical protein